MKRKDAIRLTEKKGKRDRVKKEERERVREGGSEGQKKKKE